YNGDGIDVLKAVQYSEAHGGSLEGFEGAEPISNDELLALDVDILAPCAKEDQITSRNADQVKAKIVVEGANGPTTPKADAILKDKGIMVIPDILANAGGVTVSYFEWVQDRQGYFWSIDRVNRRLDRMMRIAFDSVFDVSAKHDVTLRIGAYVDAIKKVADALRMRGIYA
ncbi:MAG: Glu/Leu/Phe/Val dehydrogenase, partial [Rhodothermales bacterium]|nr:Glu/Leu/Phe/Val dehydrogenase [Rhodothermales bacterium]